MSYIIYRTRILKLFAKKIRQIQGRTASKNVNKLLRMSCIDTVQCFKRVFFAKILGQHLFGYPALN